jgi:hypothetical protein
MVRSDPSSPDCQSTLSILFSFIIDIGNTKTACIAEYRSRWQQMVMQVRHASFAVNLYAHITCATYVAAKQALNPPAAKEGWSVEGVVETLAGGPPKIDSESPVPFFHILERLKTTKREGWRRFGIAQYVSSLLTESKQTSFGSCLLTLWPT